MGTRTVTTDCCDIYPSRVKGLEWYRVRIEAVDREGVRIREVRDRLLLLSEAGRCRMLCFVDKGMVPPGAPRGGNGQEVVDADKHGE